MRVKLYLIFATISFALQSCTPDAPGVYKNEQISSSKHQLFSKLNAQLFEALKANKPKDVEAMMSKELLEAEGNRRTIELINLNSQLGQYTLLDEYYIVNDTSATYKPITSTTVDGTKYVLRYLPTTGETYIAFMVPKTKGDKSIVTAVYYKYSYGWRLNTLSFKPYTMNGKTAPQLSLVALDQFNKGYLVDAYLTMRLVNNCLQPSNLWRYPQRAGIMAFDAKINNIINSYTYPLIIDHVPTKPKIFEVSYQTNDQVIFPVIRYVSDISINDTIGLKKESNNIKKAIGQMFLGINQDKKHIYFSAYNHRPTLKTTFPSYEWVYDLPCN